jgi:hypothetical protein
MLENLTPALAMALLLAAAAPAGAQTTTPAAGTSMGGTMTGGSMTGGPMKMGSGMDRFGGPTYTKSPDLPTTIALVDAGGGPGRFSTVAALTSLVGAELTNKEVAKLTAQYGKESVGSFVTVFDFAVDDAAKIAIAAGVKFPAPQLSGQKLAAQIVRDGTVDGTFWTGYMLDHLVTHTIHDQVMDDIDAKFGAPADANYHKIWNQAMYDLAQALGAKSVMPASFH